MRQFPDAVLCAALCALLNAGCQETETSACGDVWRCPVGYECVFEGTDGAPICEFLGYCGDEIVEGREACDDGNQEDGDGCSADCGSNETCGNGVVDELLGEQCDGGENCGTDCRPTSGCGNGVADDDEVCDDGNTIDGDGCSADCMSNERCGNGRVDIQEACDTADEDDSYCSEDCRSDGTCGNGIVDPEIMEDEMVTKEAEVCDDGNEIDGDGCSADCLSRETCGNGITDVHEECDDGNHDNGDGCDATCHME